jgi:hypothetical protein
MTEVIKKDAEGNPIVEDPGKQPGPNSGEGPTEEVAAKAARHGWKPLEEYEGDPDTWVDAKEFLGRAPLFERINKYNQRRPGYMGRC